MSRKFNIIPEKFKEGFEARLMERLHYVFENVRTRSRGQDLDIKFIDREPGLKYSVTFLVWRELVSFTETSRWHSLVYKCLHVRSPLGQQNHGVEGSQLRSLTIDVEGPDKITARTFLRLGSLPKLRDLTISDFPSNAPQSYRVDVLNVRNVPTDLAQRTLISVRSLSMERGGRPGSTFDLLSYLPYLRELDLPMEPGVPLNVIVLNHVHTLSLSPPFMFVSKLSLPNLRNLTILGLSWKTNVDPLCQLLAERPNICHLSIESTVPMDQTLIRILSHTPNIRTLCLRGYTGNHLLSALASHELLANLKYLELHIPPLHSDTSLISLYDQRAARLYVQCFYVDEVQPKAQDKRLELTPIHEVSAEARFRLQIVALGLLYRVPRTEMLSQLVSEVR
ncbi:hypothetical protein VNI00_007298 [Paramarasmius palmivorus]|uniref:F-box domain-containing protein n=1 Tax=Paramarasmius palmivorus TaxID=297713 RepID=A0AAW0D3U3_9AGAR